MNEAFCAGFIGSQIHTNADSDGITIRFQERLTSDDGEGYTKSEDVVDLPADPEVIEL